jgi:hypothetical protein
MLYASGSGARKGIALSMPVNTKTYIATELSPEGGEYFTRLLCR